MDCADGKRPDEGLGESHVIQFGRLAAQRTDSGSAASYWPTVQYAGRDYVVRLETRSATSIETRLRTVKVDNPTFQNAE